MKKNEGEIFINDFIFQITCILILKKIRETYYTFIYVGRTNNLEIARFLKTIRSWKTHFR